MWKGAIFYFVLYTVACPCVRYDKDYKIELAGFFHSALFASTYMYSAPLHSVGLLKPYDQDYEERDLPFDLAAAVQIPQDRRLGVRESPEENGRTIIVAREFNTSVFRKYKGFIPVVQLHQRAIEESGMREFKYEYKL